MKTVALNKLVGTFITGVCAGVILLTSLPASVLVHRFPGKPFWTAKSFNQHNL
jgi:hypothetical protein